MILTRNSKYLERDMAEMVVGRLMLSLFGYSYLKILFASYLLLGRNKCEIMLVMGSEYEVANSRSELFNSIKQNRVTSPSKTKKGQKKKSNADFNSHSNHVHGSAS